MGCYLDVKTSCWGIVICRSDGVLTYDIVVMHMIIKVLKSVCAWDKKFLKYCMLMRFFNAFDFRGGR